MNYLAHVFLSCHDPKLMVGNFMADFLTTKEVAYQPDFIKEGIELHKNIDSFTDENSYVKDCIAIIRPSQKKYSPVVIDILFDYFLIKNWIKYHPDSLSNFTQEVYVVLRDNVDYFPEKLKKIFPIMVEDDFLLSCKNEERIKLTFLRLKKRVKFANRLEEVYVDLQIHHDALEANFLQFFPALIAHTQNFCRC